MIFSRVMFTIIISFFYISGFAVCATASSINSNSSFQKLLGDTEWKINLKDFTLSQKKAGNTFKLKMGDEKHFGFSAFQGKDDPKNQFGPLATEYKDSLAELLEYALVFSGQEKAEQFAMSMNWEMYPQSIKNWAKIWQISVLREKWDKTGEQARNKNLAAMISEFLKKDMQPVAKAIGFEIADASMEKMGYFKAGTLEFYDKVLKNTGIPENMKVPIPLMMHLLLKPLSEPIAVKDTNSDSKGSYQVDSLFVTASLNSTNIYCAFNRALDEYEITGDTLRKDGTFAIVSPINNKEYESIFGQLFQACLKVTNAGKRKTIFLRLNLQQYPKVYQQAMQHFTLLSKPAGIIKRPGLSFIKFYEYEPEVESGFQASVKPFLKQNGYMFSSLEISFNSRQKADKYPDLKKFFKALGIKPYDKPSVPDIVYMKIILKK